MVGLVVVGACEGVTVVKVLVTFVRVVVTVVGVEVVAVGVVAGEVSVVTGSVGKVPPMPGSHSYGSRDTPASISSNDTFYVSVKGRH